MRTIKNYLRGIVLLIVGSYYIYGGIVYFSLEKGVKNPYYHHGFFLSCLGPIFFCLASLFLIFVVFLGVVALFMPEDYEPQPFFTIGVKNIKS